MSGSHCTLVAQLGLGTPGPSCCAWLPLKEKEHICTWQVYSEGLSGWGGPSIPFLWPGLQVCVENGPPQGGLGQSTYNVCSGLGPRERPWAEVLEFSLIAQAVVLLVPHSCTMCIASGVRLRATTLVPLRGGNTATTDSGTRRTCCRPGTK